MSTANFILVYMSEKIPEGQVYVPRLEPTAPIRLAERNHALSIRSSHHLPVTPVVMESCVLEVRHRVVFFEDGAMA